jgi:hypothetical protein
MTMPRYPLTGEQFEALLMLIENLSEYTATLKEGDDWDPPNTVGDAVSNARLLLTGDETP